MFEPVTPVIEPPVTPEVTRVKSLASTPVTFSLNVTVYATLAALVGLALARAIEVAVGAAVSMRKALVCVAVIVPLWSMTISTVYRPSPRPVGKVAVSESAWLVTPLSAVLEAVATVVAPDLIFSVAVPLEPELVVV